MPPKATLSKQQGGPTKQELEAINQYLAQKPDFAKLASESGADQQASTDKNQTDYDQKLQEAVKESIREHREAAEKFGKITNMPVHPKEEEVSGNLTDQVAKESSDSTASTHPMHQEDHKATSGGVATFEDHKANPGPAISENIGEPESKESLKKRAEELNK